VLEVSSRLGPYEILAPLGAGGMGEVYRARDTRLGREVAVKVLPEAVASNFERQARFEREAKAVAALSHPNILAIHDYGTQGPITYAVMELLEGETLRSRLAKGPFSWREAVELGAAIAEGLAAAHAKGIIHRDLKPENLFLTADGRVKILDFGLARVTALPNTQEETGSYVSAGTDPGIVMGTVGYMSPEQVRGQPAEAPSDIFAFGCVLFEMLTGRRAFQRETAAETMTAILHDDPPDPAVSLSQIPAELARLIRQCLAKSPSQRLQSARDLALALRATASDPSIHRLPQSRHSLPHLVVIVTAFLLIGATVTTVYFLTRHGTFRGSGPEEGVAKTVAEKANAVEALGVLPFVNEGGNPDTEYLSDGIPDTIIHSLSRLGQSDLKVRPFSSVARYKGREPDFREVGRDLDVGAVVTGRVRLRADSLSISVALVDTHQNTELWGHTYDRKLNDILALQDDMARDIAANLRLRLTGEEERRLIKRYTENTEAYRLYLKGSYFWNKRTREGLERGMECFRQAIDKDPNYALAWAGLAQAYFAFPLNTDTHPKDYCLKAKAAATKALDIDGTIAEAHSTLGAVAANYDWNWPEAERCFQRALKSNPNDSTVRMQYGTYLNKLGRFDDAKLELKQALEIDPLSPMVNAIAGRTYYFARQYGAAIEQYQKTLEIEPNFWVAHLFLGEAYAQSEGRYREALSHLEKATKLYSGQLEPRASTGYVLAKMGKTTEARQVLQELKDLSTHRYVPASYLAVIHAALGEKAEAFVALEKAYQDRVWFISTLKINPLYDSLHSDLRFEDLLQGMHLADKIAASLPNDHTVAVLPFKNDTGEPKNEYLSEEIPDEIIHSLSRVRRKDLIVRPLSSAARYQGKVVDMNTVGQELKVQTIVRGTLRHAGDKLSISVAIEDVQLQKEVWGHTYPLKPGGEIQDLRDEIARNVVAELRLQLTGEEEQRLTKRYTKNQEAYHLYLEGKYHHGKFTEEDILTGMKYFHRALDKDKNYAVAYVGLGDCCVTLGALYRGPKETYEKARQYYLDAEKIDSSAPGLAGWPAIIYMFRDWNWPAAEQEFHTYHLDLDPFPAFYQASQGRADEALKVMKEYGDIGALPPAQRNELAMAYNWAGKYEEAIDCAQKALDLDPNFPLAYLELWTAYLQKNDEKMTDKAIGEMRQLLNQGQTHPALKGMLGYAYAKAGKVEEAQKMLKELMDLNPRPYKCAFSVAWIHAALGEKEEAFKWLHKACDERDPAVIFIKVDPTLENLRSEKGFSAILKEMKLPR
jgi:serine/threonine-protein kinase